MKRILFSFILMVASCFSLSAQWDLERCIAFTKENNKELLAQKERISVSGYEKKMALSKFIPDINLSVEPDYYWKIPVESFPGEIFGLPSERVTVATGTKLSGNYGVHLNWNLVDIQQWQHIKMETLKIRSQEYGYQSMQKLLLRNVTAAYYSVQIRKHNMDISIDLSEQYMQIHALLTRQFEEGIIDKISLNQSAALLSDYLKYQSDAEIAYQESLIELKYWMGFPLDEPLEISRVDDMDVTELSQTAFIPEYLPGYNEKKTLVEISYRSWKSSKSYMVPRLSLTSSFGRVGFGENLREFSSSSSWHSNGFIGFRLNVPLVDAHGINTVKRNRAVYNRASFEFAAYRESETKKFFQTRLEREKAMQTLSSQTAVRKLAEENLFLCRQKIGQGIIDMVQLIQIQQELIKSVEAENRAKLDYMKNHIELKYLQNEID